MKKLVRHSPGCSDVHRAPASDDVKTDQLSVGSADCDADAADDYDDDDGVVDDKDSEDYHISTSGSSPSAASQPHQQLSHPSSSWDNVPSSFQRFPALAQLHHNYQMNSRDDVRLSAVDSSDTSTWSVSYSNSLNRLQPPCSVSNSHMAAVPRQFDYQSLFNGAVHQWYSTQSSPQTLLTWRRLLWLGPSTNYWRKWYTSRLMLNHMRCSLSTENIVKQSIVWQYFAALVNVSVPSE